MGFAVHQPSVCVFGRDSILGSARLATNPDPKLLGEGHRLGLETPDYLVYGVWQHAALQ
jgi:hypothetical protein